MKFLYSTLWLVLAAGPVHAADPAAALRQALVGRQVMVPFDVPVSSYGVDFDGDHQFARDDEARFDRLDTWGMALRGGDVATITEVRVSRRRIEILLGHGGLSTTDLIRLKDPSFRVGGTAVLPQDAGPHSTNVQARQAELERIMIQDEFGSRSANRAINTRMNRAESDTAGLAQARRTQRRAWIYRPGPGSRLRVLFRREVPANLLEPDPLIAALSEHVMFVDDGPDTPAAPSEDAASSQ